MLARLVSTAAVSLALAGSAIAQTAPSMPRTSVVSVQPLSALFAIFNGEFEHAVSPSVSVAIGANYWGSGAFGSDFSYVSSDVKLRFYPEAKPLQGFNFGGSLGVTHVAARAGSGGSSGSAATLGVGLEYAWLLGVNKNFYVALGGGAKRLFISSGGIPTAYPTARMAVGYAF